MMFPKLSESITEITNRNQTITAERKNRLQLLIDYIQHKLDQREVVNLNFICTHNSRRSHLSQIWAQTAAAYFNIPSVNCYSGGTEATALFPQISSTLTRQGFEIIQISKDENPIHSIKFEENGIPIIGFSKPYDHEFNPKTDFAAIMTCSQADQDCPYVPNTDLKLTLTFEDPKIADNTANMESTYHNRSLEIATQLFYVFSKIKYKTN